MYRHKKTRIAIPHIRVFYYLCPVQPLPKNVHFIL
nr:MAG TPA: Ephrin type-A receptor 2 [Caudoviricetes sp.]DAJ64157.1 MAG TPA: Ephrin type-A receptor 2 [Caudoviricetes sp.]